MIDRARDILDSYGADAARWPADERDAVLAALAADPALRAVRAEAAGLDTLLDAWATRDLGLAGDAGAAAARVLRPSRPWLRAVAGGSIAAAIAGAAIVFAPAPTMTPAATPAAALSEEAVFATVFTTTPDEDDLI